MKCNHRVTAEEEKFRPYSTRPLFFSSWHLHCRLLHHALEMSSTRPIARCEFTRHFSAVFSHGTLNHWRISSFYVVWQEKCKRGQSGGYDKYIVVCLQMSQRFLLQPQILLLGLGLWTGVRGKQWLKKYLTSGAKGARAAPSNTTK